MGSLRLTARLIGHAYVIRRARPRSRQRRSSGAHVAAAPGAIRRRAVEPDWGFGIERGSERRCSAGGWSRWRRCRYPPGPRTIRFISSPRTSRADSSSSRRSSMPRSATPCGSCRTMPCMRVKSVPGMLPEGAVPWRGRMGETISVRLDRPGSLRRQMPLGLRARHGRADRGRFRPTELAAGAGGAPPGAGQSDLRRAVRRGRLPSPPPRMQALTTASQGSSVTTTRRLAARPSGVSLSATGSSSPRPTTSIRARDIPTPPADRGRPRRGRRTAVGWPRRRRSRRCAPRSGSVRRVRTEAKARSRAVAPSA